MSRAANTIAKRVADAAPVFAALGDETRLKLLTRLCQEGPLSISRLSEGAPITRQAVSKHLGTLEDSGLVQASQKGRERIYEFTPARLRAAQSYLAQVSAEWDDALQRLRRYVETD
jgi:DNA-binding transcriptional ArsR family regulator